MKIGKIAVNQDKKWEAIGGLLLLAVFVLPFLTFAGGRRDVFVDAKASGSADGSAAHPYHTITDALKHANDRTDVHVLKGTYTENIDIPKGVKVFGSDADDVIIHADSKNKPVVTMKHNSEIDKVTVEKGDQGIRVKENAKVSIIEVVVRDNYGDGIKIEKGDVENGRKVSITDSTIIDNGKSGVFSKERRVVLINNEISGNDKDGADLAAGSSAWIEKNKIKDNGGSGMRFVLDGSNIWTKNNILRNNDHEGIEVNAFGGTGRIDVNKSRFIQNKGFGIAKIQRGSFSQSVWNGLTVQDNNEFIANKKGTVSGIIRIFER